MRKPVYRVHCRHWEYRRCYRGSRGRPPTRFPAVIKTSSCLLCSFPIKPALSMLIQISIAPFHNSLQYTFLPHNTIYIYYIRGLWILQTEKLCLISKYAQLLINIWMSLKMTDNVRIIFCMILICIKVSGLLVQWKIDRNRVNGKFTDITLARKIGEITENRSKRETVAFRLKCFCPCLILIFMRQL